MATQKNLLLLFDRPEEPIFLEKGKDGVVFDVPDKFFTDRYRQIGKQLQQRFAGSKNSPRIQVKDIPIPDMSIVTALDRQDQFSLFIPRHRIIAAHLIDIFINARNIEDLQSIAVYARDRVNVLLFNYALSVALLHRKDTKGTDLPSFVQAFPDKFVDSKVLRKLREEVSIIPEELREPIIIPRDYTASDLDEEHRLWYFREDLGVNLHHWHWHLVYPFAASDRSIVAKDRRGELFYYMHQQIIARYNFERFCNNLPRVKRFNNFSEPIEEGYFPKMDSLSASRSWPPRFANTTLKDLDREVDQITVDLSQLECWKNCFNQAIAQGFVEDESGNRIELDETRGIDILGNMMEASILSPNLKLYGDIHNMEHMFISFAHDPDNRFLESFGVMGDTATAMRDPVFYRWHAFINDMFQKHKESLLPYKVQLTYPSITVTGVQVASQGGPPNVLHTYWQQSDVDFSRGLDFVPRGDVLVRFTHLNHDSFTYTIDVNNESASELVGTVRIYLAPKTDERNHPMLFEDQRQLMIELDKFVVTLKPGQNTLCRQSVESSVTIPFERTFRSLDDSRQYSGGDGELEFNFCGCGWPQHMLIPKGRPEGMPCELFVMVSNYDEDKVDQDLVGKCSDASSYCGIRDRLYPDRRSMGFPFDRVCGFGCNRLSAFLTPNMRIVDVLIKHSDTTNASIGEKRCTLL